MSAHIKYLLTVDAATGKPIKAAWLGEAGEIVAVPVESLFAEGVPRLSHATIPSASRVEDDGNAALPLPPPIPTAPGGGWLGLSAELPQPPPVEAPGGGWLGLSGAVGGRN